MVEVPYTCRESLKVISNDSAVDEKRKTRCPSCGQLIEVERKNGQRVYEEHCDDRNKSR